MKKLIKLMSLLCALLMIVSFGLVGCKNSKDDDDEPSYKKKDTLNGMTVEEVYNDIMDTIDTYQDNFTSVTNYKIKCKTNVGGQSLTMNMTMTDTFSMQDGNFYEKTFIDAGEIMGEDLGEITNEVWYVGDTAYLNQIDTVNGNNQKMRYNSSWEYLLEFLDLEQESIFNPIYDFSNTAFDEVKFYINSEDSDDVYFDIILDGEEASNFAMKLFEKQNNGASNFEIDEIQYRFILNEDGELDHIEIDFVADVEADSMTMKYTYDGTIEFSNIGTTEVTAPADANDYLDLGNLPGYVPAE